METLTLGNVTIEVNEEGYMTNMAQWNPEVAQQIAMQEGIEELSDLHYKVLDFLRDCQQKGESLTIRRIGKSGIVDIKGFYQLFPGAPLKLASKIAGIPKPVSCI